MHMSTFYLMPTYKYACDLQALYLILPKYS